MNVGEVVPLASYSASGASISAAMLTLDWLCLMLNCLYSGDPILTVSDTFCRVPDLDCDLWLDLRDTFEVRRECGPILFKFMLTF